RQAERAVLPVDVHVLDTERRERALGALGELGADLDGLDAARELAEQRRRVARAGSDLERMIGRGRFERGQHQREHARLADGLALTDREGAVLVREVRELLRHETL